MKIYVIAGWKFIWFVAALVFCRRLAKRDISVIASFAGVLIDHGGITTWLVWLPHLQHWLFLQTWVRTVNLRHLMQFKWAVGKRQYWREIRFNKLSWRRWTNFYIGHNVKLAHICMCTIHNTAGSTKGHERKCIYSKITTVLWELTVPETVDESLLLL